MPPPPLDGEPLPDRIRSARVERDRDGDEHREQRPREIHPGCRGKYVRPTPGVSPPAQRRSAAPGRSRRDGGAPAVPDVGPLAALLAHWFLWAFAVSRM